MGKDFIAKTMAEITAAMQGSIFADTYASKNGLLQKIDPRVKIVTVLVLLIVTGLAGNIRHLCLLYGLTVILGLLSRLNLFFLFKRVWLFIPLFAGIIAIPAIFNIITPGKTLFTVVTFLSPHHLGPFFIPKEITVTLQGLTSAAMLVMRVATSVSLAVLLVVTTQWVHLLKALSVLKVPEIVILVLAMTYRYIQLLLRTVEGMLLAKKSRYISDMKIKQEHGWIVSRLGVLIGKSYRMSSDVHLAMISRGWSDNPQLMDDFSVRLIDWLWIVFVMAVTGCWVVLR